MRWTQRDDTRYTLLRVVADGPITVDRIAYRVEGASRYYRSGELQVPRSRTEGRGRHRRVVHDMISMAGFTIGSDQAPVIDPGVVRADTFELVVDNGSDPPLKFAALEALALEQVLLAELKPGMHYRFTTGDPAKPAPRYDLAHFDASLPMPLDTLAAGPVTALPQAAAGSAAFDPAKRWVWAAIAVLLIGMGWLAFRLLRRMDA